MAKLTKLTKIENKTREQGPSIDEDLTLRFRWRWNEHGIYLAVCSTIGLLVLGLLALSDSGRHRFRPELCDMIHVRYLTADEPAEKQDPFHDPRVFHAKQHGRSLAIR